MVPLESLPMKSFAMIENPLNGHVPPKVFQQVLARILTERAADYVNGRVRVRGTCHVGTYHEEGFLIMIYSIDVDGVMDLEPGK